MKTEEDNIQNIEQSLQALDLEILCKVSYPRLEKRLVDYIVKTRMEEGIAFVKFTRNINTISNYFRELKKLTSFLKINALVVTDKINDESIVEGVLHIRDRVGIIQTETLIEVAKGNRVYIYEFKGMYYVKINGRKLRELRLRKGYGLNELAKAIGTSVKALQKYEEGLIDMSVEKAYRLAKLFDEDFEHILNEVDIFKDRIIQTFSSRRMSMAKEKEMDEVRHRLLELLASQGMEAESFNYLPSDIIVKNKKIRAFISLIDNRIDIKSAIMKAQENKTISKIFDGTPVNVVKEGTSSEIMKEIENLGITFKYEHITKQGLDLKREIL